MQTVWGVMGYIITSISTSKSVRTKTKTNQGKNRIGNTYEASTKNEKEKDYISCCPRSRCNVDMYV